LFSIHGIKCNVSLSGELVEPERVTAPNAGVDKDDSATFIEISSFNVHNSSQSYHEGAFQITVTINALGSKLSCYLTKEKKNSKPVSETA